VTPLDVFSLASGVVAMVRHYLPPLHVLRRRQRNEDWEYTPINQAVTGSASLPFLYAGSRSWSAQSPFPTGQDEQQVYDELDALANELTWCAMSASTDKDAMVLKELDSRYAAALMGHRDLAAYAKARAHSARLRDAIQRTAIAIPKESS
jgi:hypothetical protein